MSNNRLEDLKRAIQELSSRDFHLLLTWLADYEQEQWDSEIADDLRAGKIDGLIKSALNEIENGEFKDM